MPTHVNVAILIVSYNARQYLPDCLNSVLASRDEGITRRIVVVDNASADGSAEYVADNFPDVDLVRSHINRGFAGGNNLGWDFIRKTYPDTDLLALLNPDTIVADGWLWPMAECIRADDTVAITQAKLRLHPRTDRLNSAGNRNHFLGFGFVTAYEELDRGQYDRIRPIDFASGAAAMIRCSLLRRVGLFDQDMFLYLEDTDLSWKVRQMGYQVLFVPASLVYHKYSPNRGHRFYYYFERNRWWVLLTYYRPATLVVLAPAAILMELGQLWFAWRAGLLAQKLASYAYFLQHANRRRLGRRRRTAQARRTVSDRQFMGGFSGTIDVPGLKHDLMRLVANPLLKLYWAVARRLIF